MIELSHVSASYDGHMLFWDLDIRFPDTGVFLLKGESGSGKTTVLNLICGLKPADGGSITYSGGQDMAKASAYLAQEAFFVEYLTVADNLALACGDGERVQKCLDSFGIGHLYGSPVATLSSGERQRVSLARAALGDRKVILLDEPTAFLDQENKDLVFEAIRLLGVDALVVFASHDQDAVSIADGVIDMAEMDRRRIDFCQGKSENPEGDQPEIQAKNTPKTLPNVYAAKWFTSSAKEKRTFAYLVLVFCLVFLALGFGDTPWHKLEYHAEKVYGVNTLQIMIRKNSGLTIADLDNGNVRSIVFDYGYNVPDGTDGAEGGVSSVDYDVEAPTLPAQKEDFRLSDRLAAGTWFTSPNQVILAMKNAQQNFGSAQAAIGQTIQIKFYGQGRVDMTVVGVFETLSLDERRYFMAAGDQDFIGEQTKFYLSDAFSNAYESDPTSWRDSSRHYIVYFDNFSDLKAYQRYCADTGMQIYSNIIIGTDLESLFYGFFVVSFPLGLLSGILALMLYSIFQSSELAFNMRSFAVFAYLDYPIRSIASAWRRASILHLTILLAVSLTISGLLMLAVNWLNSIYHFLEFMPFTFNPALIAGQSLLAIAVCAIAQKRAFRRIETEGWYGILVETRDLV